MEPVAATPSAANAANVNALSADVCPLQKLLTPNSSRFDTSTTSKLAGVFSDIVFADVLPPKRITAEAFADAICQLVDAYRGSPASSPAMSVPTPPVGHLAMQGAAPQPIRSNAQDTHAVVRHGECESNEDNKSVPAVAAKSTTGSGRCSSASPVASAPFGSATAGSQPHAGGISTPRLAGSGNSNASTPAVVVSFSGNQGPIIRPEFTRPESMSPRAASSQLCGQLTGRPAITSEAAGCSRSSSPRGRAMWNTHAFSGTVSTMPTTRVVSPPHRRSEVSPARSAFTQRLLATYAGVGGVECGGPQQQDSTSSKPATRCYSYTCDSSDPMDRVVMETLVSLGVETASRLRIRRLDVGKYEVDGRRISLRWGSNPSELVACEDDVGGDLAGRGTHLVSYLRQAADVAASLGGRQTGAPLIARVPQDMRLTFSSSGPGTESIDSEHLHRRESMRIACEEAMLRERAAEAYEHGLSRRSVMGGAPPPPAGLATSHLATSTSAHCQASASPSPRSRYQASVAPPAASTSPSPRGRYQAPVASSASSVSPSPRRRCQSSFGSPVATTATATSASFVASLGGASSNVSATQLANAPPP